jgi:molybdopterin synthase sulfur carrier subunit
MSIEVQIPTPLRALTGGADVVTATADSVGALIDSLERSHPGIKSRLVDAKGRLRSYVRIFVNEEDVRFLSSEQTPIAPGDRVAIIPAIAGG